MSIAPLALVQLTVSPLSRVVLLVPKGPRLKLVYDGIAFVLVVGALTGAHAAKLSPSIAIGLYAAARIIAYGVLFALMWMLVGANERARVLAEEKRP